MGDVEVHEDGSGRLHVLRSKIDQTGEGSVLYQGPAAVEALLAIRPQEAVVTRAPACSTCRRASSPGGSRRRRRWPVSATDSAPTRPGSGWPRT